MDTTNLFEAALNLPVPWSISKIDFKPDLSGAMELHINLSFPKGSQFACPACGAKTTAYDSAPRTWRHLNFFQYKTDETSKKGHNYVTVVVDLAQHKVIFATDGKDSTTIDRFVTDFKEHHGLPANIKIVTCDMSLGFRKGIQEHFERRARGFRNDEYFKTSFRGFAR